MDPSLKSPMAIGSVVMAVLLVGFWFLYVQPENAPREQDTSAELATGIGQFQEKQYEAAAATLARVPAGSAEEQQALYYRGSAQMMLKDYEAAVRLLEQSLALDNQDTGVLYALGVASYKLGNLKLARGYFAAVLEIDPNDADAKGLMDIMANLERRNEPEAASE